METLIEITQEDREIGLQFSFTNPGALPQFLEDLPEETMDQAIAREETNKEYEAADLTGGRFRRKMVDVRSLPVNLLQTDYILVGVWRQKRIQTNPGAVRGKPYWMIRFRFRHKDHLAEYRTKIGEPAWQEMETKRPALLGELVTICSLSFWQMRAWRNPYYQDHQVLPSVHAVSLNFAGRKPLYEWDPPKKLGDEDLPAQFEPDFVLTIG